MFIIILLNKEMRDERREKRLAFAQIRLLCSFIIFN